MSDRERAQAELILRRARQLIILRGKEKPSGGMVDLRAYAGDVYVAQTSEGSIYVWLSGTLGYAARYVVKTGTLGWKVAIMDRTLEILNQALPLEAMADA